LRPLEKVWVIGPPLKKGPIRMGRALTPVNLVRNERGFQRVNAGFLIRKTNNPMLLGDQVLVRQQLLRG